VEPSKTRDQRIGAIASLDQPLRRRLYELLAESDGGWVTRDDAATRLEVPRSVAAFHLDKLVDAGVVEVSFERTSGRTGPGAGRPSKMYRLVADEISASMPDRHYDLAGRLLAGAVAESTALGEPVDRCLGPVARAAGREVGLQARADAGADAGTPVVVTALERGGYEPDVLDHGEIALSNCPFHRLAAEHRGLVCGMNLDYLAGLVEGLDPEPHLRAHLEPEAGHCCVRLRPDRA
jgi:predicted ArsR family transcriptional regulator